MGVTPGTPGMRAAAAAVAALVVALLAPSAVRAVSRPLYGGRVALAAPDGPGALDPAEARDPRAIALASALHGGLFRYGSDDVAGPYLVEETPDPGAGGVLRCRLRRPLPFHDGRAVDAADVRWSLERLGRARGPLSWLPAVLAVRVVDRRSFDLVPAPGLSRDEAVALLSLPQAAILPRGGDGRIGVGPFRVDDATQGEVRLVAWEEAPDGRPFLDGLRFVRVGGGASEAEAFHYGQLDVSFTDAPRLRDRPRLDGPPVETLLAVFSSAWSGAGSEDERRGLAALLAPDRRELKRHFDWPASPATTWQPDGGPPSVPPEGRPDDWSGEPVTVVHRESEPGLDDVAAALRDLLSVHGMAQASAAPDRDLPPLCRGRACLRHDLLVVTLPWPTVRGGAALAWAAAWLGLEKEALPRGPRTGMARSNLAWLRFAGGGWALPLLHFRRAVRHVSGLSGVRFAPWGGLVLEDAWFSGSTARSAPKGERR